MNKFNHQGEPLEHMKLLNRRGLNTLRKRGIQTKIRDGIKRCPKIEKPLQNIPRQLANKIKQKILKIERIVIGLP